MNHDFREEEKKKERKIDPKRHFKKVDNLVDYKYL